MTVDGHVPLVRIAILLAGAAIGIGGTACGDDGSSDATGGEAPRFSAAAEPAKNFAERMSKLLATTSAKKDCAQLQAINQRSFARFGCPPSKALRASMREFEILGTEEHGPGAIVDYRSGAVENGATIVLFAAPDRNWGISQFGVITKPSTGTSDVDSRDGFERAVGDYMTAVRERDCKAYQDAAFISSDIDPKTICRGVFASTKELARRLTAHPDAKPRYEGGNSTYGFFTFETPKTEQNTTISVVKSGKGRTAKYVVLDAAPSPTTAEQARVRREFLRQQRNRSTGQSTSKDPLPQDGIGN